MTHADAVRLDLYGSFFVLKTLGGMYGVYGTRSRYKYKEFAEMHKAHFWEWNMNAAREWWNEQ
jgi:hypothetical protein